MMKIALLGILLAGTVAFLASRSSPTITGIDAQSLVRDGARLLDVRTPSEFADGHIDGAINIPVQQLANRVTELSDKKTPVVVYCRSGRRSAQARVILQQAGFAQVHDLGGMGNWETRP